MMVHFGLLSFLRRGPSHWAECLSYLSFRANQGSVVMHRNVLGAVAINRLSLEELDLPADDWEGIPRCGPKRRSLDEILQFRAFPFQSNFFFSVASVLLGCADTQLTVTDYFSSHWRKGSTRYRSSPCGRCATYGMPVEPSWLIDCSSFWFSCGLTIMMWGPT
jgi:hypothetical protein